jgi:hypothetical protein
MAINIGLVFQQINLKTLNLCGNPLNGFPSISSSRTLETICLEGKAATLPYQTAAKFPQLADVTLVASSDLAEAQFDETTQYELSNVTKLITLSIGKITAHFIRKLIFISLIDISTGQSLHQSSMPSHKHYSYIHHFPIIF